MDEPIRLFVGIALISLPTVMLGGYALLRLLGNERPGGFLTRTMFSRQDLLSEEESSGGQPVVQLRGIRQRWPQWVPYATVFWSLGYGLVALVWTVTGSGFPLGENDPNWTSSLLAGVPARVGAPLFAVVALVGFVVATAMVWAMRRGDVLTTRSRGSAVVFGAVVAGWWLLIVPDARVLAVVGYLPMIVVLAPSDPEIRASLVDAISPVHVNHVAVIVGGFLWAFATLAFARRTTARGDHEPGWTIRAVTRWARPAVYVAAAVPAVYAVTRIAWAVGIPLGIRDDLFAEGTAAGQLQAGAWLASFGLVGSVLTFGLIARWGQVFPGWLPWLGGRSVPIGLAVVPATVVSALVFSAGLGLSRSGLTGDIHFSVQSWAELGPILLWPLWGAALATATLAYYLRRRRTGRQCG